MEQQSTLYTDLPEKPGVYLFKDTDQEILYIGKAKRLKSRVRQYFSKGGDGRAKVDQMVPQIVAVEYIETNSEYEALVLEARLIREKQPRYNTDLKDDKHPIYICITKQTYPRLKLLRKTQLDDDVVSYGPFSSAKVSRNLLRTLRRVIPFCTTKTDLGRPCFYSSIGLCNPCPRMIESTDNSQEKLRLKRRYRKQIRLLEWLLQGDTGRVRRELETAMKEAAGDEQFELAGKYRDAIEQLNMLLKPRRHIDEYINNPELAHELKLQGIDQLKTVVSADWKGAIDYLHRIEAYDIATLQGEQTTGSMVVLIDGEPATSEYKRFKISDTNKHSDVHSMAEMLERRFADRNASWGQPNLLLIDGGIIQVKSVYRVLASKNIDIPIIGLAKRFETLIVPELPLEAWDGGALPYAQINLPPHSPALQTVQHIRDEAHRFARRYHHYLRSKKVLER